MTEQFTPEMQKVMERIQKLLNLAANNPSEAEAASAAARAQELLQQYNLDAAIVERSTGKDGKREEFKTRGGFYEHQRDLWGAVAKLNFCLYWTQKYYEKYDKPKFVKRYNGFRDGHMQLRHRIVGRMVNTAASKAMAEYLEQVVERLTMERLHARGEDNRQMFSRWAMSYRKGLVYRICEKLAERYKLKLDEEAREAAERAKNAPHSTATALTLTSYVESEKDANLDFVNGEGFSARRREREARRAKEKAEEDARYAQWAKENPEEARKKEEKWEKLAARYQRSAERQLENKLDFGAWNAGYNKGDEVSIDQQMGDKPVAGRLERK